MTSLEATAVQDGVPAQRSAGTPSPFRPALFPAEAALEFSQALDAVAGFAAGPLGAEQIRLRRPCLDPEWIRAELVPVAELLELLSRGTAVSAAPVPHLGQVLERLGLEGSVLDGVELVAVRHTLSAARAAVGELRRVAAEAPSLAAWIVPLPEPALDRRLAQALDESGGGELLDSASPALLAARREVVASRVRLIKKLESVLRSLDPRGAAAVTMRNGRYVIPVRRGSRGRLEGIVHDESATAETLFVEPTAAIELGNAHRGAIAAAEREAVRVLRDLTNALRPHRESLATAHRLCVALDDLVARVRYAHAYGGRVPTIRPRGEGLSLRQARHALLLARGVATVPFDLELLPAERTLLISGPNAGGKTVLLKTVGLSTALVQSGIAPPLGEGSAVPVFERIAADIGDHQSIAADLSTFTAHLVVLRSLLDQADSGTLVLMDEIGSGTDPAEGGALAAAALQALTHRGALTIATTHLGSLKALASNSPGIVNGSLQFDPDRLVPTFQFTRGMPGRSYGLAIARRLGIRPEVLADAEARISGAERSLDALLEGVEVQARQLREAQVEVESRRVALDLEAARLAREAEAQHARGAELADREKNAERRARTEARRVLLEARASVEEAIQTARGSAREEEATRSRRLLEQAIRREGEAIEALEADRRLDGSTGAPSIRAGQRVRLGAGGLGRVMSLRDDGTVLVAAGSVKVVVAAGDLTVVEDSQEKPARGQADDGSAAAMEVDLRGLRADEAEFATLSALDAAVMADNPYLRIIHGMGTGALCEVVRRVLAADRRVAGFGFAPRNQGGNGVTVADLGGPA